MARSKPPSLVPPPSNLDSPDELEARFYQALCRADIDQLMAVWADDDEVVCVHPGGARVVGPGAIRAAFEAIFANGGVTVSPEQVHRLSWLGGAVHHLVERIEVPTPQGAQTAWVLATNVYLKGPLGWRMASHHASPGGAQAPPIEGGDAPTTLH